MTDNNDYDYIIVGGGPTGVTVRKSVVAIATIAVTMAALNKIRKLNRHF